MVERKSKDGQLIREEIPYDVVVSEVEPRNPRLSVTSNKSNGAERARGVWSRDDESPSVCRERESPRKGVETEKKVDGELFV